MFRQFTDTISTNKQSNGNHSTGSTYFSSAEFHKNEKEVEDALMLAVTNGSSAWIALVKDEEFGKLVDSCRIGTRALADFVDQTTKAFAQPGNEYRTDMVDKMYVIDAKVSDNEDQLELKWKLRQTGLAQVIGHVKLFKASSVSDINARILTSSLALGRWCEYECGMLAQQIEDTEMAIVKMGELVDMPDISDQIVERTVEILNQAKRRNRELGGTTEGFEEAWELATQTATQGVTMDET